MADNLAVTAGSGTTVATDDVSDVHYQRVKISDGTADSSTHLKVVAEDAAHSSGDTGLVLMAVRQDTAAALGGTDGDYMPLIVDANGRLHSIGQDAGPSQTISFGVSGAVFTSADASTATAVTDAPTVGQKLVITDIIFSVDTAMQVDFEIETAGTIYFTCHCAANTLYQLTPRGKLKLGTADKKLMVDTSAAGNIAVTAFYYSEA